MSKFKKLNICLVIVACLMCVLVCGTALADEGATDAAPAETPVYIDGLLSCRGYMIGDCTYLPIETACAVLGYAVDKSFDEDSMTYTFNIDSIEVNLSVDDKCVCANGRCFYLPDGYQEIEGLPALPVDILAKLFTLSVDYNEDTGIYDLGTEYMALLISGDQYYNEEDLYWMSRVISYEAGNQPLEGQIGVGAVVMNRVKSDKFADTVKDVIFQPGQFNPVETKAIYLDPYKRCVLVAEMVLEGYNTVDDALYFHQGNYSEKFTSENDAFVVKIGCHNFFRNIDILKHA